MKLYNLPTATLLAIIVLSGCSNQKPKKSTVQYDAPKLLETKCASCHNLDMPPKTSDDEKAPPLYTVTVHLKDWIKSETDTENRAKFVAFLRKYVLHPSKEISYCDKDSLAKYGLMPSQSGSVTEDEVGAIASHIYNIYDQKEMLKIVQRRNYLSSLPPHKQVLESFDCKLCHVFGNGKLAPTFAMIGKKYGKDGIKQIESSITKGSKGRWQNYYGGMRAYPTITPTQLKGMAEWIVEQK